MVEPDVPIELDPVPGGEATRRSIWPAIYPELLQLVREHRSTLVFVNNRRAAERIALRLNDLAAQGSEAAGESPREIAVPTTGRSRARSAWSSRTSSSRATCRAWSPRRHWSWASTWALSTS